MLVLSRKAGEKIIIDTEIIISIISIDKNSIKIGIDAPLDKLILRGELKEALTNENLRASNKQIDISRLSAFKKV